jgi:hypothetical protein
MWVYNNVSIRMFGFYNVCCLFMRTFFNVVTSIIFTDGIPYACGAGLLVGDTHPIPYHRRRESETAC